MNLNPLSLFRRSAMSPGRKSNDMASSVLVRAGMQLGPWDALLNAFIPQMVNPYYYEALRAATPLIDGGINRLVLLDGLIRFDGTDSALCAELSASMAELPVNDVEVGIQSLYELQGNEMYEQGFGMAELVYDARGRALVGTRVADSKGMLARRNEQGNIEWWYRPPAWELVTRRDGSDQVEVVLRNNIANATPGYLNQVNYAQLDASRLVYSAMHPEADNPYGISLMRSMEFVAQNLLKIQNATGNVWDRYGDPPFRLTYTTKNRSVKAPELDKRRAALAADLSAVLDAKRLGNSADFVQAIGADDTITLEVIGAQGSVLDLSAPAKHFVEQILAKIPIPGWMIGLSDAQAGRMADQQSELVLQASKTRFERRLPALNAVVSAWLRGQNVTWKPGAWNIVQELPNLRDVMKQAQARFLNSQADLMAGQRTGGNQPIPAGLTASEGGDPNALKYTKILVRTLPDGATETEFHPRDRAPHTHGKSAAGDNDDDAEPWAEDDAALPGIESAAINGTLDLWQQFRAAALKTLGVSDLGRGGSTVFTFDASTMLQPLIENEQAFIDAAGATDGPLIRHAFAAFLRGVQNAASSLDVEATLDAARDSLRAEMAAAQLLQVKDVSTRAFQKGILDRLQQGIYDGINPNTVADMLEREFGLHDYDWIRLARSEIAAAQAAGKLREYEALGVSKVDFATAGGACPICVGLAESGPYEIGEAPMPVRDSHPNCRCSLLAHFA